MAKVIPLPKRKQDTGKNHQQIMNILKTLPKDITIPEIYKNPENKPEIELLKKLMQEDLKPIQKFTESLQELIIEVVDKKNPKAEQLLKKLGNRLIKNISKRILSSNNNKGLATPNDVRTASIGKKQVLKWLDIHEKHQKKVKELLQNTNPEILQKLEDDNNPNEIISHFIGVRLTKIELRILKTLRALVDRAFKLKEITSYSSQVRITTADFYKEYGLKQRSIGGYDNNQTKEIRKILFSNTSNLTKRIFFNNSQNKTVLITAFIMKIDWEEKNNYFNIFLDDIIFVKDGEDKYSFYYEDLQGLNRLMELMPNSNAAFELHGYLEYSLRKNSHDFNVKTLLEQSGLIRSYNKNPRRAIDTLEIILNNMIRANTLIKAWKKIASSIDQNGKYTITNIRKIDENHNKNITTKNKKDKTKYN